METEERLKEEAELRQRVITRLKQIEMEGITPMAQVVIKNLPDQKVVFIRRTIPKYNAMGELFGELFSTVMPAGLRPIGPALAVYHDPEYKADHCDVEVSIPVDDLLKNMSRRSRLRLKERKIKSAQ